MTRANGPSRTTELEFEIDETRRALDRTFDALAGKLTPQQMAMEALGVFKSGSTTLAARVIETARAHPVPATIIAAGIAMLIKEKSSGSAPAKIRFRDDTDDLGASASYGAYRDATATPGRLHNVGERVSAVGDRVADSFSSATESVASRVSAVGENVSHTAHDLRDRASETASAVRDRVAETASHVRETTAEAAERVGARAQAVASSMKERTMDMAGTVRDSAGQARVKAHDQWRDTRLSFWQTMDAQPLLIGAATLALGVIAGLAVPASRKENELMGESRDRLLGRAQEMGKEALDRGKMVARTAVDVARTEAERQGLTPADIVDKLRTVGQQAGQAVKQEAEKATTDIRGDQTAGSGTSGSSTFGTNTPRKTGFEPV